MSIEDVTAILYTLVLGYLVYRFLKNKKIINNVEKVEINDEKDRGDEQ